MKESGERTDDVVAAPWHAVALRLSHLMTLHRDEKALLANLSIPEKSFAPETNIFEEGEEQSTLYICMSGWGARYRLLPDGQRQVVDLILPGSLFGGTHSNEGQHITSAEALMDMSVAVLGIDSLQRLSASAPRLASALALCIGEESARLSERIVSLGRRDAFERLAHFFLEIHHRQAPDDNSRQPDAHIPIPQQEMADFLGLTNVHVSRTMRKMAAQGLISYDEDHVTIRDKDALINCCDFDPDRLHAAPVPEPIRNALLNL